MPASNKVWGILFTNACLQAMKTITKYILSPCHVSASSFVSGCELKLAEARHARYRLENGTQHSRLNSEGLQTILELVKVFVARTQNFHRFLRVESTLSARNMHGKDSHGAYSTRRRHAWHSRWAAKRSGCVLSASFLWVYCIVLARLLRDSIAFDTSAKCSSCVLNVLIAFCQRVYYVYSLLIDDIYVFLFVRKYCLL